MTTKTTCTGTNRSGKRCGKAPIPGGTVCRLHGGAAPQVKAAAEGRVIEARARSLAARFALPVETTPHQAVLDAVNTSAGLVAYYADQLDKLVRAGGDDALVWGVTKEINRGVDGETGADDLEITSEAAESVWLTLYNQERDRLVSISTAAIRAGIEERRVHLAEQQGAVFVAAIREIFTLLHLTPEQALAAQDAVPAVLMRLAQGIQT